MSTMLDQERETRQMAVCMRCAIAATAASKVLRGLEITPKERRNCQAVAEMLRAVSRGDAFISQTTETQGIALASLEDVQEYSTVETALDDWTTSRGKQVESLSQYLNVQSHLLDNLPKAEAEEPLRELQSFLRFLVDALDRSLLTTDSPLHLVNTRRHRTGFWRQRDNSPGKYPRLTDAFHSVT